MNNIIKFIIYLVAKGADAAKLWGEYSCDTPYRTFENLLQHLNQSADQVPLY